MNIHELLDRASSLRIAVLGDKIIDRYIDGVMERISPEAPVPILRITGTRENPGGAGNVVENLLGLGCEVSFFHGKHIPIKTRIMSGGHHIIRLDEEEEPCWMQWDDIDIGLGYGIEMRKFNCVVLSDYGKGCISKDVAKNVIELCLRSGIPVVVDSKCNFSSFEGATVVKCNYKEWYAQDMPFPESPWGWMKDNSVDNLVVTNGSDGMQYYGYQDRDEVLGNLPAHPIHITDTCGAGDTVTAVLGMMIALGEPISDACELANIAGSEVCRHPGVKPIDKELLIKRYTEIYGSKI
jgi:rfaE bifunctional protein kinase chain/domain